MVLKALMGAGEIDGLSGRMAVCLFRFVSPLATTQLAFSGPQWAHQPFQTL